MIKKQPEALRLADYLQGNYWANNQACNAAEELRRLYAVNQELLGALQSMVDLYRPKDCYIKKGDEKLLIWFPEWVKARAAIEKATGETE